MVTFSRLSILLLTALLATSDAQAMKLRFLGDLNVATGTKFEGTDLGGLSGLSYDMKRGEFRLLSDDKSEKQAARYYTARITIESGRLRFTPLSVTSLRDQSGASFPKSSIDPEAIARLDGRRSFVSSEGNGRADPRERPAVFEIDGTGRVVQSLALPEKYLPEARGKQTRGVADNGAFEGLTVTPTGRSLYAITENPLVQDDAPADFKRGALSRILQFSLKGKHRIPAAEYAYFCEPNAKPDGAVADFGNGVSEILALGEREMLVLERGTAATLKGFPNRIRIFKATLGGAATNVAGMESLRGRNVRPVKKELVLDLDTILPEMDPEHRSLDNLEAMAFGPRLPNGNRTLILVSDNNFNPLQRTLFLAFEVSEE